MDYINFTPELFRKLKKEYKKANDKKIEVFLFEGKEILVSYAKYLIEYLETKFKGIK